MFTTHLEVKGRLHVYKSLSLLKGKIVAEGRKRMQACYLEPMNGLEAILKQSLKLRLQHFVEPGQTNILNRKEASIASIA